MALSNYFTYDEYCMMLGYVFKNESEFEDCESFGDVLKKAVKELSAKGVKFSGVDSKCNKVNYIGDNLVAQVFADLVFRNHEGKLAMEAVWRGVDLLAERGIKGGER